MRAARSRLSFLEGVREDIVATAGKTLRIISVDTDGMQGGDVEGFNANKTLLRYTTRQGVDLELAFLAVVCASSFYFFFKSLSCFSLFLP